MREGDFEMTWEMAQFARECSPPPSLQRMREILEDKIRHYQIELAWAQRDLEDVLRRLAAEEAEAQKEAAGVSAAN